MSFQYSILNITYSIEVLHIARPTQVQKTKMEILKKIFTSHNSFLNNDLSSLCALCVLCGEEIFRMEHAGSRYIGRPSFFGLPPKPRDLLRGSRCSLKTEYRGWPPAARVPDTQRYSAHRVAWPLFWSLEFCRIESCPRVSFAGLKFVSDFVLRISSFSMQGYEQ